MYISALPMRSIAFPVTATASLRHNAERAPRSVELEETAGVGAEREALVAGLKNGDDAAAAQFFDLYHAHVARVLSGLLGYDAELADAIQDVFLRAYRSVGRLRSPEALTTWLTRIATLTAIDIVRARARRRWLRYVSPETLPEIEGDDLDHDGQEAMRRVYRVLDKLPAKERVAFALRRICELELTEVAESCGCSLATVKRRIAKAEKEFLAIARKDSILVLRLSDPSNRGGVSS